MPELSLETFVELLGLAVELVAMVVLSAVGLLAERAGFASLASGPDPVTVWLLGIGTIALYAGIYMLGYRRLFLRVTGAVDRRP